MPPLVRTIALMGPAERARAELVAQRPVCVAPTTSGEERNTLRRALPRLPVVLAGPSLRKVVRDAVYVWLATSVPVDVRAWVVDAGLARTASPAPLGEGTASSFPLGSRLHVTLVAILPEAPEGFPMETLLGYDMTLTLPPGVKDRFFRGEVAFHPRDLAVGSFPLPTFVVPGDGRRRVTLLHASCRKHHGAGRDALPLAFDYLEKRARAPGDRPTHLLLTGDQIYADDVHESLLPGTVRLARDLLGFDECWRIDGQQRSLASFAAGERGAFLATQGFTSGHGDNHLLGFGEWAATYLLAWSPEIWIDYGSPELENHNDLMRKLQANLPTYLMFDDHEVTDDWNLDRDWSHAVRASPHGRTVIANGLAAFWAFQWLGCDPGAPDPVRTAVLRQARRGYAPSADFEDALWSRAGWGYVADMRPPAVVLDTRTERRLQAHGPAGLLTGAAAARLGRRIAALRGGVDEPVIVVSPAPVLGVKAAETMRELASGWETFDPEDWSLHEEAFAALFDALVDSGRRRFVFLSGDVHFAYGCAGRYERRDARGSQAIDFVQFTSSAIRNEHGELVTGALLPQLSHPRVSRRRLGEYAPPGGPTRELRWKFLGGLLYTNNVGVVQLDLDAGTAAQVLLLTEPDKITHYRRVGNVPTFATVEVAGVEVRDSRGVEVRWEAIPSLLG